VENVGDKIDCHIYHAVGNVPDVREYVTNSICDGIVATTIAIVAVAFAITWLAWMLVYKAQAVATRMESKMGKARMVTLHCKFWHLHMVA